MKTFLFLLGIVFFASCQDSAKISVRNNLSGAVIRDAEWGGVPVAGRLYPGATSSKIKIYEDSYYDISFPAQYPLKFYIDYNGDVVYVETRRYYLLEKDDEITIVISDTTKVFNPVMEQR